jgi:CubicO group peptidase (beta-lactamase class C family)
VGGGAQPFEAAGLPGAIAADPPMTAAPIVAASPRTFTHGGATGTRLWVDPDRDLVFVFLTNLWGAPDAAMFATLGRVYELLDDRGTSRAAGRG